MENTPSNILFLKEMDIDICASKWALITCENCDSYYLVSNTTMVPSQSAPVEEFVIQAVGN